jgi:allophanate hydrolase
VSAAGRSAVAAVRVAYEQIAAAGRPEVWIALRPLIDALAEARALDARTGDLPLRGLTLAVKDNIDVAGLPTTAGCPAYAYEPDGDAAVVARLRAAGAIVLGKTNLDQFATGLVGTRSPYGAVRDARRPEYVSGGSSSGSAVAVALGMADLALGTDTAGSGRVPAAFQGLVGLKPTVGLVPNHGVVPACRTLDCVTVFARTLPGAEQAAAIMAGPDPRDPRGRARPAGSPLAAPPAPRVAVPDAASLTDLTPAARRAFAAAARRLEAAGARLTGVDLEPFAAAAALLYGGAFVAERHAAVGAFVDAHREAVDPTVGAIIAGAAAWSAAQLVADGERVDDLRAAARAALQGADALLLPTTTAQPTIEEVAADPVGANSRLGAYTNSCNLLDLCAVAVPAGEADGGWFGVTVLAPAFHDAVAADVAGLVLGEAPSAAAPAGAVALLVVGAHRSGQPLNAELTGRGGRRLGVTRTAPGYALYALDTEPPKPGLVRSDGDARIEGELWALPPAGLAGLLAELPPPMTLGPVDLEDGRRVVGFGCEARALEGAQDITHRGSWLEHLAASAV